MKTGRFSEAIDAYLKITSKQTSDVSLLCRCWENAANVAIEQVSSRISEVVPLVCKRLVSIEKFDSAANIYLSIDAFAEAIDMYLAVFFSYFYNKLFNRPRITRKQKLLPKRLPLICFHLWSKVVVVLQL